MQDKGGPRWVRISGLVFSGFCFKARLRRKTPPLTSFEVVSLVLDFHRAHLR